MPVSADPALNPLLDPALDFCPRVCPAHRSSSAIVSDPKGTLDGRSSVTGAIAATDPGRLACIRRHRQGGPAGPAAVGTYCVSLPLRAIADSGTQRDPAGADHRGADLREFPLS